MSVNRTRAWYIDVKWPKEPKVTEWLKEASSATSESQKRAFYAEKWSEFSGGESSGLRRQQIALTVVEDRLQQVKWRFTCPDKISPLKNFEGGEVKSFDSTLLTYLRWSVWLLVRSWSRLVVPLRQERASERMLKCAPCLEVKYSRLAHVLDPFRHSSSEFLNV